MRESERLTDSFLPRITTSHFYWRRRIFTFRFPCSRYRHTKLLDTHLDLTDNLKTAIHSFIHSTGMCRMRRFLAVLKSFFHSSLLCTFSRHPSPPTILPSSLSSSCHLFLGLPLNIVPRFIYNTLLGILFSSILCTCTNQRNLFNLIVSIIVGFLTHA